MKFIVGITNPEYIEFDANSEIVDFYLNLLYNNKDRNKTKR